MSNGLSQKNSSQAMREEVAKPRGIDDYRRGKWSKRAKNYLLGDLYEMEFGELGMSDAQKQQSIAANQQQATAQLDAQQAGAHRDQLASGSGFSGYEAQAARNLGAQAAEGGAQAALGVETASQQLGAARTKEIRGRLEAQQERSRDNHRYWAQFGIDAGEAIASMIAMTSEAGMSMSSGGGGGEGEGGGMQAAMAAM